MPILIYGKCRLNLKGGRIRFEVPIRRGLLKIGHRYEVFTYKEPSQVRLHGQLIINGECWLGTAFALYIGPNGVLTVGDMSSQGSHGQLICDKMITFSKCSRIGSGSHVTDSNYHYMKVLEDNSIRRLEKEVFIGENNYIGSRVSILAGTITPPNITVGLGSVCNKDYTQTIPENSIIAGVPARLLKRGLVRIFDFEKEKKITDYFCQNESDVFYDVVE